MVDMMADETVAQMVDMMADEMVAQMVVKTAA